MELLSKLRPPPLSPFRHLARQARGSPGKGCIFANRLHCRSLELYDFDGRVVGVPVPFRRAGVQFEERIQIAFFVDVKLSGFLLGLAKSGWNDLEVDIGIVKVVERFERVSGRIKSEIAHRPWPTMPTTVSATPGTTVKDDCIRSITHALIPSIFGDWKAGNFRNRIACVECGIQHKSCYN